MTGDINFFRKRFLGGFNREDVVSYIAKLGRENSELAAAKEKAVRDVSVLESEVAQLRLEVEETKRQLTDGNERKAYLFEAIGNTLSEFEGSFNGLRSEIEKDTAAVTAWLENVGNTVAKLPPMLAAAGEKFVELRTAYIEEKGAGINIGEPLDSTLSDMQSPPPQTQGWNQQFWSAERG